MLDSMGRVCGTVTLFCCSNEHISSVSELSLSLLSGGAVGQYTYGLPPQRLPLLQPQT